MLLAFLWRRQILRRSTDAQAAIVDKLERLETLVYSLPLTGSWRAIFELVRSMNLDGEGSATTLARLGGIIAIFLFTCQVLYMAKYGLYTWLVLQLERKAAKTTFGDRMRENRDKMRRSIVSDRLSVVSERITNRWSQIGLERMRTRTSYTCKRFANHAPYWQFVVWLRQFLLTWVTFIPGILAAAGNASETEYIRGNADSLLAIQVSLSLTILVVAAAFHWRTKPFGFVFQNWLEMWLLMASIALITLAAIYSTTRGLAEGIAIEILLTATLIISLVAAAVYLVIHYRAYLREMAAKKALEIEEALKRMSSRSSSSFFRTKTSANLGMGVEESRSKAPRKTHLGSVRFAEGTDRAPAGPTSVQPTECSIGPVRSSLRGSRARAAAFGAPVGVRGSRASSNDRISIMINPLGRQTWRSGRGGTIIADWEEKGGETDIDATIAKPLPPLPTPSMIEEAAPALAEEAASASSDLHSSPSACDAEWASTRLSVAHSSKSVLSSDSADDLPSIEAPALVATVSASHDGVSASTNVSVTDDQTRI